MAEQRYAAALADVIRQQHLIAELEKDGRRTTGARILLRLLEGDLRKAKEAFETLSDQNSNPRSN